MTKSQVKSIKIGGQSFELLPTPPGHVRRFTVAGLTEPAVGFECEVDPPKLLRDIHRATSPGDRSKIDRVELVQWLKGIEAGWRKRDQHTYADLIKEVAYRIDVGEV